jgi:nitrogen regulatory protein P-II 1
MRLIIALIQPARLRTVQEALTRIGVSRMTVCDALGYGRQLGDERSTGRQGNQPATSPTLLRKVALEIAVNEDFLDRTVETIARIARTGPEGSIGDGKVFVLPLDEVVRLSDTVRGVEAIS